MGVSVFFVLSGFLITWLLLKENDQTGTVSLKNFYIRRTLRIFPAFYVYWAFCILAFVWMGREFEWAETWSAFFYCGDYYHGIHEEAKRIMVITWSLGVEEKFYLLWPWVFARYRNDLPKLLRITVFVMVAIWAYRIVMMTGFALPRNYLKYAFEARLDNILYGCLLALLVKSGRLRGAMRAVSAHPALPLLTISGLLASLWVQEVAGKTYHYGLGMSLDAVLTVILFVQLITWTASPLWSWLEWKPMRFLGFLSYSLYLYHTVVIALIKYVGMPRFAIQLVSYVVFSVAAAGVSYYLVEKPFLRLKERFAVKPDRQMVAAGTGGQREPVS